MIRCQPELKKRAVSNPPPAQVNYLGFNKPSYLGHSIFSMGRWIENLVKAQVNTAMKIFPMPPLAIMPTINQPVCFYAPEEAILAH